MLKRLSMTMTGRRTSAVQASGGSANAITSNDLEGINEGDMEAKTDPEKVQRKTFRRWVNRHLKERDVKVEHIINDWIDGIKLTVLLEELSKNPFNPKMNKNPKMKLHNLENLNACINYIKGPLKINLVNVGSDDVFSKNPTIVMGLIWMLILKYSVVGGKAEVMSGVNAKIAEKGLCVKNFDKDFQDGMVFAALVASKCPNDLDFSKCSRDDASGNMEKAFSIAERCMSVPKLLDVNDVIQHPDEKSVMAYVGELLGAMNKVALVPSPRTFIVTDVQKTTCDLSWDDASLVNSCSGFKLEVQNMNTMDIILNETLNSTDTKYQAKNLEPETEYRFSILAFDSENHESEKKNVQATTLLSVNEPTGLTMKQIGSKSAVASWVKVPSAASYVIEWTSNDDPSLKGTTTISNVSSDEGSCECKIPDLSPETQYNVKVFAVSKKNNRSSESSCKFNTTPDSLPAPEVSEISSTGALLTWSGLPEATGYIAQVKPSKNNDWLSAKTYKTNEKTLSLAGELDPASVYDARILTQCDGGVEVLSDSAIIQTQVPTPDAPEVSNITNNTAKIMWNPVPNATSYLVECKEASGGGGDDDDDWEDAVEMVTQVETLNKEGLEPGKDYDFRITTLSESGRKSEPSPSVRVVTTKSNKGRVALVMGGDFKSAVAMLQKLLEPSSSWDGGFSKVFVCCDKPSALLQIAAKSPKLVLLEGFQSQNVASIEKCRNTLYSQTETVDVVINTIGIPASVVGALLHQP